MEMISKHTVAEVFDDFEGRRVGMIKALTDDVDNFFQKCDPKQENVCLYGYPNGTWEVNVPLEEVPAELPEPALGINFARDGMERKEWLLLVAVHCDCWLKSVAFYFGARFGFEKDDRNRLFQLINDVPTVYEVVNMKTKEQPSNPKRSKGKTDKKAKPSKSGQVKVIKMPKQEVKREEQKGGDDDGQGSSFCGACGIAYVDDSVEDDFWICCDMCERWYHGKCVDVTPKKAENIKKYECPNCRNNKRVKI